MSAAALGVWLWLGLAQEAAPRIEAVVVPERVTVGSRFALRVQVRTEPGVSIIFPTALDSTDAVTGVGPADVRRGGDTLWTAEYESAAWAPGVHALPPLEVVVRRAGAAPALVQVPASQIVVFSVLPAGERVEPRPPKDVWGWPWAWWEVLAAVLAAVALLALVLYASRRRRRRPRPLPQITTDPRSVAIAALDTLRQRGVSWLVRGDSKSYYTQLSQILRYYLQAVREPWSPDLTSAELIVRLRADGVSSFHAFELSDILGEADLVKFAPVRPTVRDAAALTERARAWVQGFTPPEPEAPAPEGVVVAAAAGKPAAP